MLCMRVFVCLRRADSRLYVTLRQSKNAVISLFPTPSHVYWPLGALQTSQSGALMLKLCHCTLAKSSNTFNLDFNTIEALLGPCVEQDYFSTHRIHLHWILWALQCGWRVVRRVLRVCDVVFNTIGGQGNFNGSLTLKDLFPALILTPMCGVKFAGCFSFPFLTKITMVCSPFFVKHSWKQGNSWVWAEWRICELCVCQSPNHFFLLQAVCFVSFLP